MHDNVSEQLPDSPIELDGANGGCGTPLERTYTVEYTVKFTLLEDIEVHEGCSTEAECEALAIQNGLHVLSVGINPLLLGGYEVVGDGEIVG